MWRGTKVYTCMCQWDGVTVGTRWKASSGFWGCLRGCPGIHTTWGTFSRSRGWACEGRRRLGQAQWEGCAVSRRFSRPSTAGRLVFGRGPGSVRGVSGVLHRLLDSGCVEGQADAGGSRHPGAQRFYCRSLRVGPAAGSRSSRFVAAEVAPRLGAWACEGWRPPRLGVLNKTADWLSRRAEPGKSGDPEPACLKGVRRKPVPNWDSSLFVLPLPIGVSKSLWGCAS